eukprot:6316224-Amphidinium_carterae.1
MPGQPCISASAGTTSSPWTREYLARVRRTSANLNCVSSGSVRRIQLLTTTYAYLPDSMLTLKMKHHAYTSAAKVPSRSKSSAT